MGEGREKSCIWASSSVESVLVWLRWPMNLINCRFLLKHSWGTCVMLKWPLQSLIFFPCDFLLSFFWGSEYLPEQRSLASNAESVTLQSMSHEAFERTVTIAKGSSSLGKLHFSPQEDSGFQHHFICREWMLEMLLLLFMCLFFFLKWEQVCLFHTFYTPHFLISKYS